MLVAAVTAVLGVALQSLHPSDAAHLLGFGLSTVSWLVFAADAVVMLAVTPQPAQWAWSHGFELIVLVVACPLWPVLFHDLLVLQLSPALTVLEATKLAKLVKVARAVRHRGSGQVGGRLVAGIILVAALVVAVLVFRH